MKSLTPRNLSVIRASPVVLELQLSLSCLLRTSPSWSLTWHFTGNFRTEQTNNCFQNRKLSSSPSRKRQVKQKTLSLFYSLTWLLTWPLGSRQKCQLPLLFFFSLISFSLVKKEVLNFLPVPLLPVSAAPRPLPTLVSVREVTLSYFTGSLCVYPSSGPSFQDYCSGVWIWLYIDPAGTLDDPLNLLH